jgi:hypothetical protein
MREVLNGTEPSDLSDVERQAVTEILAATKPEFVSMAGRTK